MIFFYVYICYFLNNYLTKDLYLAPAAHIVHLPSGVKMLMVLVSSTLGAIAIVIIGFLWATGYIKKLEIKKGLYLNYPDQLLPAKSQQ
mgnify:CR=1 FL=1